MYFLRGEKAGHFISSQLWERKGRVPMKGGNVCSVHYEEWRFKPFSYSADCLGAKKSRAEVLLEGKVVPISSHSPSDFLDPLKHIHNVPPGHLCGSLSHTLGFSSLCRKSYIQCSLLLAKKKRRFKSTQSILWVTDWLQSSWSPGSDTKVALYFPLHLAVTVSVAPSRGLSKYFLCKWKLVFYPLCFWFLFDP